jgi:dihydrofolate reductase
LADKFNSLPKYVVSSTLEDPEWDNSTVLDGDVVKEVSRLKRELDGDIVVYGSFRLARTLIQQDLVDELRLMVYPVLLGAGERMFGEPFQSSGARRASGNVAASQQERGEGAEGGDAGGEHGEGLRAVHERPAEGARPA